MFSATVTARTAGAPPIWGIGVSVPGPVEFATGRPIAPPIMPGWDGYPVRERLAATFDVPVWVDNDVNLMALGELRSGLAQGERDVVYIKIGTGIGAGLVSGGRLHRGAEGCAGDVGHVAVVDDTSIVCRCGKNGCLEALAGGAALARDATAAAVAGHSPYLAELLSGGRRPDARDVSHAAQHGDPFSVDLLTRSGQLVGAMLATLVNFYNPSLVIIGGRVAASGDLLLAAVREAVYRRSLPLATRNLRIMRSPLADRAGLIGASAMVVDELLSQQLLARWIHHGSPVGQPELAEAGRL
jgi:glucokinase-like ROK family protein